jgi:nucleotide-binding universal stress UspA family protein
MKKMLVSLDGSQASEVVLPTASAIAEACGYEMILFSVSDIGWDAPIQDKERVRDLADRGRGYLKTYLNGVAKEVEQEGIRCDTSVSSGHAAVEILAAITGSSADLVAMATHGRRATTEGVAAASPTKCCAALLFLSSPLVRLAAASRRDVDRRRSSGSSCR